MARKSRSHYHTPLLFSLESGDTAVALEDPSPQQEGDSHALQDDHSRTAASEHEVARDAPLRSDAASGHGVTCDSAEGAARGAEGAARHDANRHRIESGIERGDGDRGHGDGESFAGRVSAGRAGGTVAGRRDGVRPKSHVARLKWSRSPTLWDLPGEETHEDAIGQAVHGEHSESQVSYSTESNEQHHATQSAIPNDTAPAPVVQFAGGEKEKARDILAAIRTLQQIEREKRPASFEEKQVLARFPGFGPVALSIFPDPVTGRYKNAGWQVLGEELQALLSPAEYDSAKRTTFNAFYTSPTVIGAIHDAIKRLGVPDNAQILEPGCGSGNFMSQGGGRHCFIGVELDSISGRIARALHPEHDIRIENFRDTKLPEGRVGAVVGNVPFADIKLEYDGKRLSLHDYFLAKSVDALNPGGVMAMVTTHFTLDKQNAAIREYLASKADFVGAIRLPSDAFKREGTNVVTDILFFRKRAPGDPEHHADPDWLGVAPLAIDGLEIPINRYFLNHPEMVLGDWSRKDTLYGGEGYSVRGNGDLTAKLKDAIRQLPEFAPTHTDHATEKHAPEFTPPPPEKHINEGSFFVGADQAINQLVSRQAVPVVYGGKTLKATGALTGRRMAALIGLRDCARRVLQSQNEDWPVEHRDEARRELNRVYDRFVRAYGPINKTTFGETRDGSVIRRRPNLVKFIEDPDAMLVMSLEEYDEVTGKAAKAAIMTKDVVGRTPPVTNVASAEEGLLVSLNQRGRVDLPFIAELYDKPEQQIIEELGDLIYRDPESKQWKTADEYLSGNVRHKLAVAEKAGPTFARNAEALRRVQPEDVLPGDIDANLGAPWIPASDIQAFAAQLFHVSPEAVPVAHLEKDAVWSFDAGYAAKQSVAATSDYGTERANGTWLLELALNMKSPTIYDVIDRGDKEERVVNQEETMAAREKQKQIKERFRAWVFTDHERTERLVRIYNDTYNNLRPRLFDGSHLDFPGMNQTIQLRPHQTAAVWRGMSSGNTLLAHVVGAGKTFTMAATGMKMKQAGLIKKPMYVVPNHLLEQFSREFMQLYPNAKLLVATKEDLRRDRRKLLTAKIASGDWDGILVTHSSFERIGMSRDYQEEFLVEQIAEYDQLLIEHAAAKGSNRNIIKQIEKQKAARVERLKKLLAQEKKDDGLVFDELGVDHVFIDEAHYFKNLETPTKMDRVAGIQTGGSERAFDVFMKASYLGEQHPGHGVTFATGTPVSNTMVEMYTMQRFLDPAGLESRGLEHFDAWAATFGEVIDTMEISPDGASLRPRSRFAKFTNLPELQQMFRAFSDVQTAEMLKLPTPKLETGKAIVVACPMSDEQHALQDELVKRYERLRRDKVDPREDNALAITTDGRKLALDARMLSATAPDFPGSKINRLVENVHDIWQRTADTRGTQMIFCDMGVRTTPWGYSAYDDVTEKLIAAGIPREQIAAIGDADSDAKKQALFEKVRNGSVRVLVGSTQKMGTGTNVQQRLVALHHLDAPWKPAEVEQREGRILRQGNTNEEVAVYRYVTEGSFDAYMWQALETKARFIGQVITGDNAARRAEDVGGQELSYAEVKAIASGNPAVLTLAEADAELQRLALLKKNHVDEQYIARRSVRDLPERIARLNERISKLTADQSTAVAHARDPVMINRREYAKDEAVAALGAQLDKLPRDVREEQRFPIGTYRGLRFGLVLHRDFAPDAYIEGETTRDDRLIRGSHGPRAVLNALERLCNAYGNEIAGVRQDLSIAESQLRDYQHRIGKPFVHEPYQTELAALRDRLKASLAGIPSHVGSDASPDPASEPPLSTAELAERIKALKAAHTIDAAPVRTTTRRLDAEVPVTARIRRRSADLSTEPVPPDDAAADFHPNDFKLSTHSDLPSKVHENLDGTIRLLQQRRSERPATPSQPWKRR
ncbi:MAG: DEAD/DEAH box helicase family protein [Phycisphaerae bacterium]|nr:DEAD/DEAH box helicase family protein [Phycisphaerae bacterium]